MELFNHVYFLKEIMLKRNPHTQTWVMYILRFVFDFQDKLTWGTLFFPRIHTHLTSIFKKSYIASLLWGQDLIQPRLDLNLDLRIILNFWYSCLLFPSIQTIGMRRHTQLAAFLDDGWILNETVARKKFKNSHFCCCFRDKVFTLYSWLAWTC